MNELNGVGAAGRDVGGVAGQPLFTVASEIIQRTGGAKWIIKGMLEEQCISQLYGPPGVGKSFLALGMACAVATGTEWHRHKVMRGAVVYVAGEGQGGMSRRLRAWQKNSGVSLEGAKLFVSHRAVSLLDTDSAMTEMEAIESQLSPGEKPTLVVVDTLSRAFVGGDENSNQHMGLFVRTIEAMKARWGANVLIVHHSGKDASKGGRGSSVLPCALEADFCLEKRGGKSNLVCKKMKDGPKAPDFLFTLKTVELEKVIDCFGEEEVVTSAVTVQCEAQESAMNLLVSKFLGAMQGGWTSYRQMAAALECSEKTLAKMIEDCEKDGVIMSEGQGRCKRYFLSEYAEADTV